MNDPSFFRWLLLFAIFAGFQQPLFGLIQCSPTDTLSPELQSWVQLYDSGWKGDDQALQAFFETAALHEQEWRHSPLLRAIYGSACIARARLVPNLQKPRWLRSGAEHLNAAVKAAPEAVAPRLLRAVSFAVLPRRAGEIETVRADFNLLVKAAERHDLAENCRQKIFYHAGAFALRDRDPRALTLLRLAAELDPEEGLERARLKRILRSAENLIEEK